MFVAASRIEHSRSSSSSKAAHVDVDFRNSSSHDNDSLVAMIQQEYHRSEPEHHEHRREHEQHFLTANTQQQTARVLHRPAVIRPVPRNGMRLAQNSSTSRMGAPQSAGVMHPSVVLPDVLIRPVPLKVARPIPAHATQAFYQAAHAAGIPATAVHAAVMESHDWHRKWTQQDEVGHTEPQSNQANEEEEDVMPNYYAYQEMVLRRGARNPSPGSPQDSIQMMIPQMDTSLLAERKRSRGDEVVVAPSNVSPMTPSDDEGYATAIMKQRPASAQQHPGPAPPGLVRPVPLRVSRPAAAVYPVAERDPVHSAHHHIPRDIMQSLQSSSFSLSPLTLVSMEESHHRRRRRRGNTQPKAPDQTIEPDYRHEYDEDDNQYTNVHIIQDDDEDDDLDDHVAPLQTIVHPNNHHKTCSSTSTVHQEHALLQNHIFSLKQTARDGILEELAISGGETTSAKFNECLAVLHSHFVQRQVDTCANTCHETEGMWLSLTKPSFFANLGETDAGDPLYTLGRMAFDMFAPTQLVCSLQGTFNSVDRVNDADRLAMLHQVPKSLQEDVQSGRAVLRTYNVVAAFTIEPTLAAYPNAPNKDVRRPIRGIMTVYGYTLADPEQPNRHSVWITGGKIEPNDAARDQEDWKRLFELHPPVHSFGEQAKLLAVKMLMGASTPKAMEADLSMQYSFTRPLGGHGMAYVDTLYVDETLRMVKGHRGTTFVFSRMDYKST